MMRGSPIFPFFALHLLLAVAIWFCVIELPCAASVATLPFSPRAIQELQMSGNLTEDSKTYARWLHHLEQYHNAPYQNFHFGKDEKDRNENEILLPRGKKTVITMDTSDGLNRSAIIYIPKSVGASSLEKKKKVPLLLMFHGLGDNCDHFLDATEFISHAERDQVILVSGCGTVGYLGLGWNAGMCCGFSKDGEPDDVEFVRSLIDRLFSEVPEIDPFQVASMGFSNGAMLSEVLGCTAPDLIRAVMSVGGVTEPRPGNDGGLDACDTAMNHQRALDGVPWGVHMLFVHGDADWKVPWSGNRFIGFPSIPENTERWLRRQGCYPAFNTSTIHTEKYENIIYPFCEPPLKMKDIDTNIHNSSMSGLTARNDGDSNKSSQTNIFRPTVELVRAKNVGHIWPSDAEFDTGSAIFQLLKKLKQ